MRVSPLEVLEFVYLVLFVVCSVDPPQPIFSHRFHFLSLFPSNCHNLRASDDGEHTQNCISSRSRFSLRSFAILVSGSQGRIEPRG